MSTIRRANQELAGVPQWLLAEPWSTICNANP
jgi:hypothetical protein